MAPSESTGHIPSWIDSGWVKALESVYDRFRSDPETPANTVRFSSAFVAATGSIGLKEIEGGRRLDSVRSIESPTVRASIIPLGSSSVRDFPVGSLIVAGIGAGIMIGGLITTSPCWALAGLVVLALGAAACGDGTVSPTSLFEGARICEGPIIPVTLTTHFQVDEEGMMTVPDRSDTEWLDKPATITFCEGDDAQTYPIAIRLRGIYRRRSCAVPPVEIKFLGEMPWFLEGADPEVKVVHECILHEYVDTIYGETDEERDQMALSEHLVYEAVEALMPTIRTRLGDFTLLGAEDQIAQGLGFFRENEDDFAARVGLIELDYEREDFFSEEIMDEIRSRLRIDDAIAVILIDRLVGDYDLHKLHHNIILLGYPDGSIGQAPYDFDLGDVVQCPVSAYRSLESCSGVGSYAETYSKIRDEIHKYIFDNNQEEGFYEYSQMLERFDSEAKRMAFVRVAEDFLSRRDAVVAVTEHHLLSPEWREVMSVQYSAFFDALEDTLSDVSG